ncbi:bifunctional folylpolyglutamate synthase/dihydrofolate synthase [Chloroflexota bacterium]
MNYQEALDYILKFADYERLPRSGVVWDLARVERLLEKLGNPQAAARTVHVAGTKGKGSTAAMIASILKQAGYRVGLYTSPHLLSFTERIRADGQPVAEADWARLTGALRPEVEAVNETGGLGELTTFEILTALAFSYFREVGADYQVLETGLGGRLDATNVVKPDVCVITSISYDHTDVLGDTLAQIAGEKAGIIKPGCAVVCSPQFPEAMEVIEKTCRERGVRLVRVGSEVTWQPGDFDAEGQSFHLKGMEREYDLRLSLLGAHQMENAATAVAAVEALAGRGAQISPRHIADGLAQVRWPGRLQVLRRQPWVIVDSAHNAYSVKRLGEALRQYFQFDRIILVLGVSLDKDITGIVAEAAALTGDVILASSRHPRAVAPDKLIDEFARRGVTPRTAESVAAAMKLALETANPGDLICAAGSVFVVAEVLEEMGEVK